MQAKACPEELRPFAIVVTGSAVILLGPSPGNQLLSTGHWLDCIAPGFGACFGLQCKDGPHMLGLLAWLIFGGLTIWILVRLFLAFSSIVISSTAKLVAPDDRSCRVLPVDSGSSIYCGYAGLMG